MASVEGAAATADPSETDRATGEDATVDEAATTGPAPTRLAAAR